MFDKLLARLKDNLGITPIKEKDPLDKYLNEPLTSSHREYPFPPPGFKSPLNPMPMLDTGVSPEDIEVISRALGERLKPRLVVDNTPAREGEVLYRKIGDAYVPVQPPQPPVMIYPANRTLNKAWVDYNKYWYGYSDEQAYNVGANLMMNSEFGEKMRNNVEILAFDPSQPLKVRIKYHDRLKEPK